MTKPRQRNLYYVCPRDYQASERGCSVVAHDVAEALDIGAAYLDGMGIYPNGSADDLVALLQERAVTPRVGVRPTSSRSDSGTPVA